MDTLQKNDLLKSEMERLKKISSTLQGLRKLIEIYEVQFSEKYEHGCNVVYELSRVNVLRMNRNEIVLI